MGDALLGSGWSLRVQKEQNEIEDEGIDDQAVNKVEKPADPRQEMTGILHFTGTLQAGFSQVAHHAAEEQQDADHLG